MILKVVAGLLIVADLWVVMIALAQRLPPGLAKDLASFLPDCVTMLRRLWRDPRVPTRSRVVLGFAALWAISPIDLIPEFLPVIGPLDDIVVVALALRYAVRQVPPEVVSEAWPGSQRLLGRLLGGASTVSDNAGP